MLLTIDIGNTNIAVGVFREEDLVEHWQIRSEAGKTCDEYAVTLQNLFSLSGFAVKNVTGVIISSVVPPLTPVFQKLSLDLMHQKAFVVGPGLKTGMPILYDNPQDVGADRVVSAVAAFAKYGGPCIVVDFGTATTFDAVSIDGEYLGGAIAPGVHISAEALFLRTAKLPRFEIKKPESAIGRTTVSSMQSGLYFGYIGLVSKIIDVMSCELGEDVKVISTGGFAPIVYKEIGSIGFHEPYLVFDGLRILYERNKK